MCKSINESSLLIKLEVVTELWIKAKQEPCDFYVELAELLSDFDQLYCRSYCYFGYIKAWCNLLTERNLRGLNLDHSKEFDHSFDSLLALLVLFTLTLAYS